MAFAASDFEMIRSLVLKHAGIVIEPGKEYLVEARLSALMQREAIASLAELLGKLRLGVGVGAAELERKVVESMTTNETSFFRDVHPFEALKSVVLPEIIKRRASERKLAIWCAASSMGQEPYTIAMILREAFPQLADWNVQFIASDLSRDVLQRARAGRYSQFEVNRGLPEGLLNKYFRKQGLDWEIVPEVRKMVDFREVNLLGDWPTMPPLDIVFIRNVLIYFDQATKKRIFARIRAMLRPSGFLFLGGAETTLNLDDNFERAPVEGSGCYHLRPAPLAQAA